MQLGLTNVGGICDERLKDWRRGLEKSNCTPILLVGVSHDGDKGEVHLFIPEGVSPKHLANILNMAGLEVKRKVVWKKVVAAFGDEFPHEEESGEDQ